MKTGKPKWRGEAGERELPFRSHIREQCPEGTDGFNVQDIDLAILNACDERKDDPILTFYEFKKGKATPNIAQEALFYVLDNIFTRFSPFRLGDKTIHYGGYHLVQYPWKRNWKDWQWITVNNRTFRIEEYEAILQNELLLNSYNFPLYVNHLVNGPSLSAEELRRLTM